MSWMALAVCQQQGVCPCASTGARELGDVPMLPLLPGSSGSTSSSWRGLCWDWIRQLEAASMLPALLHPISLLSWVIVQVLPGCNSLGERGEGECEEIPLCLSLIGAFQLPIWFHSGSLVQPGHLGNQVVKIPGWGELPLPFFPLAAFWKQHTSRDLRLPPA